MRLRSSCVTFGASASLGRNSESDRVSLMRHSEQYQRHGCDLRSWICSPIASETLGEPVEVVDRH